MVTIVCDVFLVYKRLPRPSDWPPRVIGRSIQVSTEHPTSMTWSLINPTQEHTTTTSPSHLLHLTPMPHLPLPRPKQVLPNPRCNLGEAVVRYALRRCTSLPARPALYHSCPSSLVARSCRQLPRLRVDDFDFFFPNCKVKVLILILKVEIRDDIGAGDDRGAPPWPFPNPRLAHPYGLPSLGFVGKK